MDEATPPGRSLLKRLSNFDDEPAEAGPSSGVLAIKRRQVRAKKLRRPGDDSLLDGDENIAPVAAPAIEPEPEKTTSTSAAPEEPISRPRSATPPSRVSPSPQSLGFPRSAYAPLRSKHPPLTSCRSVYSYTRLNHIEEGTYGVVFRARCNDTGDIYALKKLKLDEEKHGFPITSLREIMALQTAGDHENVVGIREVVVGDTLNQ